jgi:hypothetical protein
MRPIIVETRAILLCALTLYLVVLGAALAIAPPPDRREVVNTQAAASTIFTTEPKYLYFNRTPLAVNRTNIVLVGGSNIGTGFPLSALDRQIQSDAAIHNLGLGGANVTEMAQVTDLVYDAQSEPVRSRDIFVVGIWYGLFGEDRLHWHTADRVPGDTDLDIERYRYGLERRTLQGPVDFVPPAYRNAAVVAVYPLLFLDKVSRSAFRWISPVHAQTAEELDAYIVSQQEKDHYLKYWRTMMGPTQPSSFDEQFAVLDKICDRVLAQGGRLLLVDLPLPRWHKTASPYQAIYETRAHQLFDRLSGRPGFGFLDMGDLDNDADFYDEVHPKPRAAAIWVNRLAAALSPLLRSPTAPAPPDTLRLEQRPHISSLTRTSPEVPTREGDGR